ncbi:MAG: hypothetical protein RIK87_12270 [Fuerstiella sp.]
MKILLRYRKTTLVPSYGATDLLTIKHRLLPETGFLWSRLPRTPVAGRLIGSAVTAGRSLRGGACAAAAGIPPRKTRFRRAQVISGRRLT